MLQNSLRMGGYWWLYSSFKLDFALKFWVLFGDHVSVYVYNKNMKCNSVLFTFLTYVKELVIR